MAKLHTKQWRKSKNRIPLKKRTRSRPKTFSTEEAAKKYAEAEGIKEYVLVNISAKQNQPKIRVEAKILS
ncbi:MAG: hypothetical protein ABIA37_00090 [Candidatus Woesearchaeota archaeon]